jgi:hypothetical protein
MLLLRHASKYLVTYQNMVLEIQQTVLVWKASAGKYLEMHVIMDTSIRRYLEICVLGPIVWTRQLQGPSHREEQESWIPLHICSRESQLFGSH